MRKVLAAFLVAAILVGVGAVAVDAQTFYQRFENIYARSLRTDGAATIGGAATVGGALAVTGNASANGNLSVVGTTSLGGNVTAGDLMGFEYAGNLTVTDGGTIVPTRTFQQLSAAGSVGVTVTTVTRGAIVTLVNMANQTITITDTGTTMLGSNAALGQYDTLTLISDGTNMIELARANN